jgi:hypothetical protein
MNLELRPCRKGYDELKLMFFGLAVGVALMWSARR